MNKEPLAKYPFFCQLHNNSNSIKSNKNKGGQANNVQAIFFILHEL